MESAFGLADGFVFAAYFLVVIITGVASMCLSNRSTVKEFFLAGRHMTWLPIGASLFASNIGSEHFIGLAGSGAASGIGIGAFELNACFLLLLLGWVFLPVYIANGIVTLPQYLEKRFGGQRIKVYLAVLSLVLYIFTKISVNLFSGAIFIKVALNWNVWISILLLLSLTALVTMTGGLTAVIYTDTIQAVIMIIGSSILTISGMWHVGGFSEFLRKYPLAIANTTLNSTCGWPSRYSFHLLRPINDNDIPWLGFLLGQTTASIWYWCADQIIVQRALAARSLAHAQGGTLLAGYFKLTPLFIMVLPGMISRILDPNIIACSDPDACEAICGSRAGCSNFAFPQLVVRIMPQGLRGLLMAVMVSALVTDLTSIFNSASTLFTIDIYMKFRRQASTREQLLVGRLAILALVALSIAWVPIISNLQGSQMLIYIQDVVANLSPPLASVYLAAVFWPRSTEVGAFYSLMWGLVIGSIRLIATSLYPAPACGDPDLRPEWIRILPHYMYFAMFSAFSTLIVLICISFFTQSQTEEQVKNLTIFTMEKLEDEDESDQQAENAANLPSELEMLEVNSNDGSVDDGAGMSPKKSMMKHFHHWIHVVSGGADVAAPEDTAASCLHSIHRTPKEKAVLTIFLVILVFIATFLLIFLSVAPPELDRQNILLGNTTTQASFE